MKWAYRERASPKCPAVSGPYRASIRLRSRSMLICLSYFPPRAAVVHACRREEMPRPFVDGTVMRILAAASSNSSIRSSAGSSWSRKRSGKFREDRNSATAVFARSMNSSISRWDSHRGTAATRRGRPSRTKIFVSGRSRSSAPRPRRARVSRFATISICRSISPISPRIFSRPLPVPCRPRKICTSS